jgi:hypothetical protein
MGGDSRFDDMRGKFLSLLGFWAIQAVWVWTVACKFSSRCTGGLLLTSR